MSNSNPFYIVDLEYGAVVIRDDGEETVEREDD